MNFRLIYLFLISTLLFLSCKKSSLKKDGNIKITRDIVYGTNINWEGQNENLTLDIYSPKLKQDPGTQELVAEKFPLVVFIHGGGFLTRDKSDGQSFGRSLAAKGYVVASINYRVGWKQGTGDKCDVDSNEVNKAIYRALQDSRASLRFLTAKADQYNIDPNWIFISGSSAGAITALNTVYYDQAVANNLYPITSKDLGSINSGNKLTNDFDIKGIISMWGSTNNMDIVDKNTARPTLFFHGEKDDEIPFGTGHFNFCDNLPISYGTKPLYDKLISLNVPAIAHIDPDGGHNVYSDSFIADNSICFIKKVMSGNPFSGFYYNEDGNCN